jgi:hypothetical protein
MPKVKINHPSAAPGATRLQAHICAVEVKARSRRGNTDQRIPPDNDEILIQADHARGKGAAALVFAMRIGNADNKAAIRHGPGIAGKRPIRIKRIQRRKAGAERFDIIAEQPDILMAKNHISAARQAQETPDTLEGIPLVALGIVQVEEFGPVRREAARLKAFQHGCVFHLARDQGANAEQRPRKGLAGIYRLLRWDHPHKIIPATELRKMSLRCATP